MVHPFLGVLGMLLLVSQASKPAKSAFDIGTGRLLVLLQQEPLQDELRIPPAERSAQGMGRGTPGPRPRDRGGGGSSRT